MREKILHWVALAVLLMTAGYFRFSGLLWGEYHYQHPDERFLVWVVADLKQVEQWQDYFDTAQSTLNPANRGHSFFVYGTLPVFVTRYLVDAFFSQPGWQEILQVGRALSASSDLFTVLLVYLTAAHLLGRRLALLAGWFSALAVLQIQLAHYFTVDSFATAFTMLAVYLAVRMVGDRSSVQEKTASLQESPSLSETTRANLLASLAFGAAVGLAMACKLNIFPVALLLPAAMFINWGRTGRAAPKVSHLLRDLLAGGLVAFLVFRVCQPYAFEGPTFFNFLPDQGWLSSISEQRAQAAGDVDFPPALQWARRLPWFSWENLTVWGLGLPLGLAAWGGVIGFGGLLIQRVRRAGWRMLVCSPWSGLLLLWSWTLVYFTWQALAWNPTMRYQLPVYPPLIILAAWGLGAAWRLPNRAARLAVGVGGGLVAVLSLGWALAFVQIYQRPETRSEASHWIYANVPGPINLELSQDGLLAQQLLAVEQGLSLRLESNYRTTFYPNQSAWLTQIDLPYTRVYAGDDPEHDARVVARILDLQTGQPLAASIARLSELNGSGRAEMVFDPLWVESGQVYGLELRLVSLGGALQFQLDGQIQLHMFARQALVDEGQYSGIFSSPAAGTLRRIRLMVINPPAVLPDQLVVRAVNGELRTARLSPAPGSTAPILNLDPPLELSPGALYLASLEGPPDGQLVQIGFHIHVLDGPILQSLPAPVRLVKEDQPLIVSFRAVQDSQLNALHLWRAVQEDPLAGGPAELRLSMAESSRPAVPLLRASQQVMPVNAGGDARGEQVTFAVDPPLLLKGGQMYTLRLEVRGPGVVAVRGSSPVNETDWDMGLPFRALGYDAYGGLYQRGLNFQIYWDDNSDKLLRFVDTLNQADYIFISSNRQWGTTTRIPERYPLTSEYYRRLLGCPDGREVVWCYRTAEVGDFEGALGFDLVQVFSSYPQLGPLRINTQFAEEAFTVYDHPKVFVFQKRADYDPIRVKALLSAVDLQTVVRLTPKKASGWSSLLLPAARSVGHQAGGTWAQLFPPLAVRNHYPPAAAVLWWWFLTLLGWLAYPLVRRALPGLNDHGYPLARMVGLLLLAYPVWLAGSLGVTVSPALILAALLALAGVGFGLAWGQRQALAAELRARAGYYVGVELLAVSCFLAFLAVRIANPDLWHVIFGGEKPMDFAYFNAVLKSSTFPPYDPWFAGGYLNYYYYGFVIFGMPVKLLGITPAVAYNLLLPALFSLVALGAFSLGWNLLAAAHVAAHGNFTRHLWRAGLLSAAAVLVLGNQGTLRMVWQGWQRLAASQAAISASGAWQRAAYAIEGMQRNLSGQPFAYYPGDWYWIPSRAIQPGTAGEITEYPFFSFLYGDLHAHLMALPVTLLILAWALSVIVSAARWDQPLNLALGMGLGALAVGSLRAANAWDHPTYLALALIALVYGVLKAARLTAARPADHWVMPWIYLVGLLAGLWAGSALLFAPFNAWFQPGYSQIRPWIGTQTDMSSFLVHWGLFLFVIATWLAHEVFDWMSVTPFSALRRLKPFQPLIALAGLALGAMLLFLTLRGVQVAWVVLPLGTACLVLLLRPEQPDGKRAVLLIAGSGLLLTLLVEVMALQGDRMNTVFKFYFQAWTLLSISAAVGLAWLLPALRTWSVGWRRLWLCLLGLLVLGAAANTVVATCAKLADRMAASPTGLDGMAYMEYARLLDGPPGGEGAEMDLAHDYYAIRWMQANVEGSPVIVEAHTGEYRHWGSRFSIYTGLPGVIGWENHQRQQRPAQGEWITRRIQAVREFYLTSDRDQAAAFLRRYQVEYVIVGQLERIYLPGPGLDKFRALNGFLWERVYAQGETEIYRVIRSNP